jgi:hypothetical protein
MFGRWLFVRLNAAEKALRDGRLDDACLAVEQSDLREHPRGQKLVEDLVRPLVARARLSRQAGRLKDALADLDRLMGWGRDTPEVHALRAQIVAEAKQEARADAADKVAAQRAADLLRAGRLDTVRLDLDNVGDTQRRAALAKELERRVVRAEEIATQAGKALDRDDLLGALRLWQDAIQRHGRSAETDAVAGRLAATCGEAVLRWLGEGQIERMLAVRALLEPLTDMEPRVAETARVVELCARAAEQLGAGDYVGLRNVLLRLKAVREGVAWVSGALDALADITAAQDRLTASPLGLCASRGAADAFHRQDAGATLHWQDAGATSHRQDAGTTEGVRLERPLLVLVDGVGSALLVNGDRVRLGRGGSSTPVDVPLPGDLHAHHADIIRKGEDYFLTAYGRVAVNERCVEHTLLRDGDRVVLGEQTKLVFSRPSAKSPSAVLRLSHRNRLAQDVSQVILFNETCLIGPMPNCHLRTREGQDQAVVFVRSAARASGAALYVRQTAGEGWAAAPVQPVCAGQTLDCGEIRLTVKPYTWTC